MKFLLCVFLCFSVNIYASSFELFAKGSASKTNLSADKNTINVSVSTGAAFSIFSAVRIEGRYTNIASLQNRLDVITESAFLGTMSDIHTETTIASVGLDIDILGPRSFFQPFIFVGAGYVKTKRSYYFSPAELSQAYLYNDPEQTGVSGNLGFGFRLLIAKAFALELELFGYGMDIDKPKPLIDYYGTVGVRLFL